MSGALPHIKGNSVLELPFKAGTGGVYSYRGVILDSTTGGGVGDAAKGSVILPATAFTNAQTFLGVCNGPIQAASLDPATPNPVIAAGIHVNIRVIGTIAIQCDTSVNGAPILSGDRVALTAGSAGYEGCISKAAITANAANAGQHLVGIALNKCSTNGAFVVVLLRGQEV